MTSSEIAAAWRSAFGEVAPVGFACREALPDRWLRIHSLPGSKRYPESEPEYAELLVRHNEVATAVLGARAACLLFVSQLDTSPGVPDVADLPGVDGARLAGVEELSLPLDGDPRGEYWIRVAAAPVLWERGQFDEVVRAVADERGRVLFANVQARTAYAPYDGGADLFFASPEPIRAAKRKWRPWLPSRRDGL